MDAEKKARTGIYDKFRVERTDGRSATGEKHDGCRYFVLDMNHDPHAIPALRAYADSCEQSLPALADDLHYAAEIMEHQMGTAKGVMRNVGLNASTWTRQATESDD